MTLPDTAARSRETLRAIIIEEFKPRRSGALRGHCRVQLRSGMILEDVSIFRGDDGRCWIGMPAKPMIDRDGSVIRDERGKVKYLSMINFNTRATRDNLSDQIIAAVAAKFPEAFDD